MVDTAAWLVDRVIPQVPVRQWVLSLPYRVRHVCAYLGLRLEFQEPVQGPVMLGYGSHFGLGLMRPGSDS